MHLRIDNPQEHLLLKEVIIYGKKKRSSWINGFYLKTGLLLRSFIIRFDPPDNGYRERSKRARIPDTIRYPEFRIQSLVEMLVEGMYVHN